MNEMHDCGPRDEVSEADARSEAERAATAALVHVFFQIASTRSAQTAATWCRTDAQREQAIARQLVREALLRLAKRRRCSRSAAVAVLLKDVAAGNFKEHGITGTTMTVALDARGRRARPRVGVLPSRRTLLRWLSARPGRP